jgi:threonine dehydratase
MRLHPAILPRGAVAGGPSRIADVATAVLTRDDVLRAAEAIRGRVHRTPTLSSASLGPGRWLKAELLQRTGSFKPRGVLTKLAGLSAEERASGVIGVSAGNHAQALAWAAAAEGIDALVVTWQGASEAKIAATRAYGAAVDLESTGPGDAFERLEELRAESGRVFVHPFDDPVVLAGQGTVGLEIAEDVPGVDTIVVACGGGGLVSGIAVACAPLGIRVVAVEPELSPALHAGLAAGRPVPVEPRSVADGLNAPFAGEQAVALCAALGVESILVSEEEIADAMRFLYARAKLACEPAGAVATAAVRSGRVEGERVVSVVSGGNVSPETASAILAGR